MSDHAPPPCCRANAGIQSRAARKTTIASLSVVLLIGIALFARHASIQSRTPLVDGVSRPQDVIASLMDEATRGDLATIESKLSAGDSKALAAMRHIHDQRSELTGHVVSDVAITDEQNASLLVEVIYRRENEQYKFDLKRIDEIWKVTGATPVGRFSPRVPYGATVEP